MCVCVSQVESETFMSELKLSNTTGRLVQLEREVGLLRQNNLEVNRLAETAEWITDQAKLNAEEAQQVTHTHTVYSSILILPDQRKKHTKCFYPSNTGLFV